MELAIVGLGRMGADMSRRLMQGGHAPVVTDLAAAPVQELVEEGARGAASVAEAVAQLKAPRVVWCMVPSGDATEQVVQQALSALSPGDVLVDGANSNWEDSRRRAAQAEKAGVLWLDAGVSGGVWGLEEGYCLMVGGKDEAFEIAKPILETLAPEGGLAHVGPEGTGHFVKMIHNGIEYGMLQAYGEGFEALATYPHHDLDLPAIADLWGHGAVVRSWLLELLAHALHDDPRLEHLEGYVADSGMGRWTVDFAVANAVPMPAVTAALYARFASREKDAFSNRAIAALRHQFGGHKTKKAG